MNDQPDLEQPVERHGAGLPSPRDTPLSGGLRFLVELISWVAGPWAAAELAGSVWIAIPTLLLLLALPAVFNVPGDKQVTGVVVSGPVRIGIEALLLAVAVLGAWVVWPLWAAVLVMLVGAAMFATGLPRYRWMAAR